MNSKRPKMSSTDTDNQQVVQAEKALSEAEKALDQAQINVYNKKEALQDLLNQLARKADNEAAKDKIRIRGLKKLENEGFRMGLAMGGETQEFYEEHFLTGLSSEKLDKLRNSININQKCP